MSFGSIIEERFLYFCKIISINLLQLTVNGTNGKLDGVPFGVAVA